MKNGNYVKLIKVIPINFNLKSDLEKESILNSYKIFLKLVISMYKLLFKVIKKIYLIIFPK